MRLRIKEIMIKRGSASVWLANEIGVTKATISNLINEWYLSAQTAVRNTRKYNPYYPVNTK